MVNPHECAPLTPLFRLVFAPFRSQILAFRAQKRSKKSILQIGRWHGRGMVRGFERPRCEVRSKIEKVLSSFELLIYPHCKVRSTFTKVFDEIWTFYCEVRSEINEVLEQIWTTDSIAEWMHTEKRSTDSDEFRDNQKVFPDASTVPQLLFVTPLFPLDHDPDLSFSMTMRHCR